MTKVSGTIKDLEWVDLHGDGTCYQVSNCNALQYYSCITYRGRLGWGYNDSLHHTLEAAKSAAQADYNARILAAIQPEQEPKILSASEFLDFTRPLPDHPYDEQFDNQRDVENNPCGAWAAIQHMAHHLFTTPSSAGMVSIEAAARVLLASCPNPIFDILKPALMGEIRERVCQTDEYGDEVTVDRQVPWDTMKTVIREALRALAGKRG